MTIEAEAEDGCVEAAVTFDEQFGLSAFFFEVFFPAIEEIKFFFWYLERVEKLSV